MPLPVSKKQIAKLGDRLVTGEATKEDWDLYAEVLDVYDQNTTAVRRAIDEIDWSTVLDREVELAVTARTKTLGTLLDKLERTPEVKLPAIRDISGVRIVGDLFLSEQDKIGDHLIETFECPNAKVVDRRAEPMSGYRALHVVLSVGGLPIEVQIRTELQALWADLYERLADSWGRQMRYGEAPLPGPDGTAQARTEFVNELQSLSTGEIAQIEVLRQEIAEFVADKGVEEQLEQRLRRVRRQRGPESVKKQTEIRTALAQLRTDSKVLEQRSVNLHSVYKGRLAGLAKLAEHIS